MAYIINCCVQTPFHYPTLLAYQSPRTSKTSTRQKQTCSLRMRPSPCGLVSSKYVTLFWSVIIAPLLGRSISFKKKKKNATTQQQEKILVSQITPNPYKNKIKKKNIINRQDDNLICSVWKCGHAAVRRNISLHFNEIHWGLLDMSHVTNEWL